MTHWSERQRTMLEAMGLRLWQPAAGPKDAPVTAAAGPVAAPAMARAIPQPTPSARPALSAGRPGRSGVPSVVPPPPSARRAAAPAAASIVAPTAIAPPDALLGPAGPPLAPDGAPLAIERMDWAALEATVAGCVACPLAAGRTQTVFGTGHRQAHWMIVGEAPGEQEDLTGEPFVGVSGRLLDAMLRALGLTRADAPPERQVYIANTVKCRPPGNRNPQPAELARCEAYLARQIALVRPRVIVAMGRFAAQSLLRSDLPIGKLRGTLHRYGGVPLVATYHPA